MKRSGQHAPQISEVLRKQSHRMLRARLRDRRRSSGREAVVYLIIICRILITLFGAILRVAKISKPKDGVYRNDPLSSLFPKNHGFGHKICQFGTHLEMIEGLVLEVEGVDRGDMQIPLPPYAIVVGNAIHYK